MTTLAGALLFVATGVCGFEPEGAERLRALAERYEKCPVLVFESSARRPAPWAEHRLRFVIASSGAFSETHWVERTAGEHAKWRDRPAAMTVFDGVTCWESEPGSFAIYTARPWGDVAATPPGIHQWAYSPAVVVTKFVEWFASAQDLRVTVEGDRMVASSDTIGLELTSSATDFRILRLVYGGPKGPWFEYTYSEHLTVAPGVPPVATRRQQVLAKLDDSGHRVVDRDGTLDFRVEVSKNPKADLAFDPVALKLVKLDPATGDVTSPDGTYLYYNERRLNAMLDERSFWTRARPWALGVGGAVALVCMVVGVRRRLAR